MKKNHAIILLLNVSFLLHKISGIVRQFGDSASGVNIVEKEPITVFLPILTVLQNKSKRRSYNRFSYIGFLKETATWF
jgi:hypothetical protein